MDRRAATGGAPALLVWPGDQLVAYIEMRTYKLELRHAPSKNKLNAIKGNRLAPLTLRLPSDDEAIAWAREELLGLCDRKRGHHYQYVEASLWELLPLGAGTADDDKRRLGRWVLNLDGVNWRPKAA
jgi:hypothetical protein